MYVDILSPIIMEQDYKLENNGLKSEEMDVARKVGLNFYVELEPSVNVADLEIDVEGNSWRKETIFQREPFHLNVERIHF